MAGKISNLTGVWLGLYSYPRLLQPASFTATLIETESWISGSTHEASHYDGETLLATLIGSRDGNAVSFVKTYEQVNRGYGPPVRYEGHVSEDGTEIEGRWTMSRRLGRQISDGAFRRRRGSASQKKVC